MKKVIAVLLFVLLGLMISTAVINYDNTAMAETVINEGDRLVVEIHCANTSHNPVAAQFCKDMPQTLSFLTKPPEGETFWFRVDFVPLEMDGAFTVSMFISFMYPQELGPYSVSVWGTTLLCKTKDVDALHKPLLEMFVTHVYEWTMERLGGLVDQLRESNIPERGIPERGNRDKEFDIYV